MIYPPAPWKSFHFGGYYLKQTKMARLMAAFNQPVKHYLRNDISKVADTLDALGAVKWRLNE